MWITKNGKPHDTDWKKQNQREYQAKKNKWHKSYITVSRLQSERNWTAAAIKKFIKRKPKELNGEHGIVRFFERKYILQIEKTDEFQKWIIKREAMQLEQKRLSALLNDIYDLSLNNNLERINEIIQKNKRLIPFKKQAILAMAIEHNNLDFVKLLVEQGADITSNSAIRNAIENEFLDIVKFLVSQGADIATNDSIKLASENKKTEVLKYIIDDIIENNPESIKNAIIKIKPAHLPILKKALLENETKKVQQSSEREMDFGL